MQYIFIPLSPPLSISIMFSFCLCSWWLQESNVCTADSCVCVCVCAWLCVMRTRTRFLEWMNGKDVEEFNKAVALHFVGLLQHTHKRITLNSPETPPTQEVRVPEGGEAWKGTDPSHSCLLSLSPSLLIQTVSLFLHIYRGGLIVPLCLRRILLAHTHHKHKSAQKSKISWLGLDFWIFF